MSREDQSSPCPPVPGTPLGDPIEMGAAAAVFLHNKSSSSSSNLTLLAAKSWLGHSEPAAGIAGIAHAHLALQHQMQLPVLHLKEVNPHVASALEGGLTAGQFQMPRQPAGMLGQTQLNAGSVLRCGVSAFAFQVSTNLQTWSKHRIMNMYQKWLILQVCVGCNAWNRCRCKLLYTAKMRSMLSGRLFTCCLAN